MRFRLHRLISAAILLGWLAPCVGALGVGLHLASEHHGGYGLEHEREIADLVEAATHGHHHDLETAPDHHHEARFDGQTPELRHALSVVAVLPGTPAISMTRVGRSSDGRSRRRGSPTPLFTATCSLLL